MHKLIRMGEIYNNVKTNSLLSHDNEKDTLLFLLYYT